MSKKPDAFFINPSLERIKHLLGDVWAPNWVRKCPFEVWKDGYWHVDVVARDGAQAAAPLRPVTATEEVKP